MSTVSEILKHKIVAIIRGAEPCDVLEIAEALHRGGVRCLEITLNSADALKVIENVSKKMGDRILVGAGTVLNANEASDAIVAGAKFIISPIMSFDTIRKLKTWGP